MVSRMAPGPIMPPLMPPPAQLITSPQSQCQAHSITGSRSPRALAATGFSARGSVLSPTLAQMEGGKSDSSSPPSGDSIPKLEPFNRSRITRLMKEPSLLRKAEQAMTDRCMNLDGDEAYKCWEAVFEFEDMKKEYEEGCEVATAEDRSSACAPLERFENLVRQSGGASSLIDNVRSVAFANKKLAENEEMTKQSASGKLPSGDDKSGTDSTATQPGHVDTVKAEEIRQPVHDHEPDGLPKSEEEQRYEEGALMPESSLTRMLRRRGPRDSSWF